jgi:hypothetical protein
MHLFAWNRVEGVAVDEALGGCISRRAAIIWVGQVFDILAPFNIKQFNPLLERRTHSKAGE